MVFDFNVTPKMACRTRRMITVCGLFGIVLVGVNGALSSKATANPYEAIIKRNAFDLTDAPPPAKAPPPEPPKNLDVKFTGIYRLKGIEKACLALIDSTAKPPETKYLQLPVGDKDGSIEITAIDTNAGTVSLIKDGSPLELSLKNAEHTYKTSVAKAPSKSSKSRPASSKPSSRSSSSSRPTSGRSSGSSSSRSGVGTSRRTTSSSGGVGAAGVSRTSRAVPSRVRSYPAPSVMKGGDPTVQALEMIHQKDMAESKGVPMPPLPFQGDLQDAPPPNDARQMPPVPGMPPGAPPLVPPVPPGG